MSTGEADSEPPNETRRMESSPQLVALSLGRLLSRWSYFAVQQRLGAVAAIDLADEILNEIAEVARALFVPARREAIHTAIQVAHQEWTTSHSLEWYQEDLFDFRRRLESTVIDPAAYRYEVARFMPPVEYLRARLIHLLNEGLNDERRGFFDLGVWLEQGRCNPEVAYQVLAPAMTPQATEERGSNSWSPPTDIPARSESGTALRPARFFQFDMGPSPLGWFDGVRNRWQQLGEPYVTIPLAAERLDALQEAPPAEVVGEVERLVRNTVLLVEQTQRPLDGHDVAATSPGYLGLILDGGHLVVGRVGTNEIVDLSETPLDWPILLLLNRQRTAFTTLAHLREIWQQYGNEPDSGDRTKVNRIGRMSRDLRPLGLQIRGTRSVGWRLEELIDD